MIINVLINNHINPIRMSCVICCNNISTAKAIMPCCLAEMCTACFGNCIAKNTGTEEGNTRNKCVFCRETIFDEVQSSKKDSIVLENYKETVYDQALQLNRLEKMIDDFDDEIEEYEIKLSAEKDINEYTNTILTKEVEENVRKAFIITRRSDTIQNLHKQIKELEKNLNRPSCIKDKNGLCCCPIGGWGDDSSIYEQDYNYSSPQLNYLDNMNNVDLNDWLITTIFEGADNDYMDIEDIEDID